VPKLSSYDRVMGPEPENRRDRLAIVGGREEQGQEFTPVGEGGLISVFGTWFGDSSWPRYTAGDLDRHSTCHFFAPSRRRGNEKTSTLSENTLVRR